MFLSLKHLLKKKECSIGYDSKLFHASEISLRKVYKFDENLFRSTLKYSIYKQLRIFLGIETTFWQVWYYMLVYQSCRSSGIKETYLYFIYTGFEWLK